MTTVRLERNICIDKRFDGQAKVDEELRPIVNENCSFSEPAPEIVQLDDKITALETSLTSLFAQLVSNSKDSKSEISSLEQNLRAKLNEISWKFQQFQEFQRQKNQCDDQISSLKQSNLKMTSELRILKLSKSEVEVKNFEREKNIEKLNKENVEKWNNEKIELQTEKLELKNQLKHEKAQCQQQFQQQLNLIREFQQKLELQWNASCVAETKELRKNFQIKLDEIDELDDRLQKRKAEVKEKNEKISSLQKKIELLTHSKSSTQNSNSKN